MVVAVMVIVDAHRVFVQGECLVRTCTACAAVLLLTDSCVQQQDADGGVRQNASPTADDEGHTVQNGGHIGNRDERSAVSLAGDQVVETRTDDINADQHGDNLKTDLYEHEQARIGSEADEAGHGQSQALSHGQIKRNQAQNQHRDGASSEILGTAIIEHHGLARFDQLYIVLVLIAHACRLTGHLLLRCRTLLGAYRLALLLCRCGLRCLLCALALHADFLLLHAGRRARCTALCSRACCLLLGCKLRGCCRVCRVLSVGLVDHTADLG